MSAACALRNWNPVCVMQKHADVDQRDRYGVDMDAMFFDTS